ncbi:hypothetical protein CHS0354_038154 [Potamilus streckersoni]|uniref:Uncharacterized protein n=1 Tax=Potamilus streckersoni TaxID=2493646 RepID=A0AAE0VXR2_9BIVA|nr:hypothetical protein CHS0354_038154 [Potamilus streckersoni]
MTVKCKNIDFRALRHKRRPMFVERCLIVTKPDGSLQMPYQDICVKKTKLHLEVEPTATVTLDLNAERFAKDSADSGGGDGGDDSAKP